MHDESDVVVKICVRDDDTPRKDGDGARVTEPIGMFERMRQTLFGSAFKKQDQAITTPQKKIEAIDCANNINIEAFSVQSKSSKTNEV